MFIAHNIDEYFYPVGNLEDVSIAIWLESLQLHPTHIPGVLSLFDAIQLKASTRPLNAVDSINSVSELLNTQHACCRCNAESVERLISANMTDKESDYFPLIAIHSIKSIADFDTINDREFRSTSYATTLNDLLINYNDEDFLCDSICLTDAIIDYAIVSGEKML